MRWRSGRGQKGKRRATDRNERRRQVHRKGFSTTEITVITEASSRRRAWNSRSVRILRRASQLNRASMGKGAQLIGRRTSWQQLDQPCVLGIALGWCLSIRQISYLSGLGRVGGSKLVTKNSYFKKS